MKASRIYSALAVSALAAGYFVSAPTQAALAVDGVLGNGVAVSVPNTPAGGAQNYTIAIPAGATNLIIATTSNGSGDADLYVKAGAAPTTSSYDCAPFNSTSNESCTFADPIVGTYYVMVRSYSSFTNVSVMASYTTSASGIVPLANGVARTQLGGAAGATAVYSLAVPATTGKLIFTISGGTGNANLVVNFGSLPTLYVADCFANDVGNNGVCTFTPPRAGTYFVELRAASAYSGVTLVATYPDPSGFGSLTNGIPVVVPDTAIHGSQRYTLTVPPSASSVVFRISGGGDADLYVKVGSAPTTTSWDCRPYIDGSSETCSFANPAAGTYYVTVVAYASFSGVHLVGTYTAPPSGGGNVLTNGVQVTVPATATGASENYTMTVPGSATNLSFQIFGGTGDADLYVKFGSDPTSTSYDCRPYVAGSSEICNIPIVDSGTYYVRVNAYAAFTGVQLIGSYDVPS